jgi:hypothetical protein
MKSLISSATFALLAISAHAATVYPVSVTSTSAGTDFRTAGNLANGTGLNASELHVFGNFETSWATNGAGVDYFDPANPVTLTIDLGSDMTFDAFKTWAYGGTTGDGSTKQANSIRDFSLKFATSVEGTGGFGTRAENGSCRYVCNWLGKITCDIP